MNQLLCSLQPALKTDHRRSSKADLVAEAIGWCEGA